MTIIQTDLPDSPVKFRRLLEEIRKPYTRLASDVGTTLYHYTDRVGFAGILRDRGLRASHRLNMTDTREFSYATQIVNTAIDALDSDIDLPPIKSRMAEEYRKNFERVLSTSEEYSDAYCACVTVSGDDKNQWVDHADSGRGFAIGINFEVLYRVQVERIYRANPFLCPHPVIYNPQHQMELIESLLRAPIRYLAARGGLPNSNPVELTHSYREALADVFAEVVTCINFIKHPKYAREREIRMLLDLNNGSFTARDVKYYDRAGTHIPYRFFELSCPATGRIPIKEVIIGPEATFNDAHSFVENILDELGYGTNRSPRPIILPSTVSRESS